MLIVPKAKMIGMKIFKKIMRSAVCLLSADCLLGQILLRAAGHLENFPSCCYRSFQTVSSEMGHWPDAGGN